MAFYNYISWTNFFGYHAFDFFPYDALAQFLPPKIEVVL